jgi:hypothetical protein
VGSYHLPDKGPVTTVRSLPFAPQRGSSGVLIFAALIAIGAGFLAAYWFSVGLPAWAVVMASFSLTLNWWVAGNAAILWPGRSGLVRIRHHPDKTEIIASPVGPFVDVGMASILLSATVWLTYVALEAGITDSDLRPLAVMIGITIVSTIPVFAKHGRIFKRNELCISPFSITQGSTPGLSWDEITEITYQNGKLQLLTAAGSEHMALAELKSDPQLVAEIAAFYFKHPEARPELTDHRAIQRIRFHQFSPLMSQKAEA